MAGPIIGLHHVTTLSSNAIEANAFHVETLGMRRVKMTVNADRPDVYHLYYGNAHGDAGTIVSTYPFPNLSRGRAGVGEVGSLVLSVPPGAIPRWRERLDRAGIAVIGTEDSFGRNRLWFEGPDGEQMALQVVTDDKRPHMPNSSVDERFAIRGLHSVHLRVRNQQRTCRMLELLGFERGPEERGVLRMTLPGETTTGARCVDVEEVPDGPDAATGAGSIHHVAFAIAEGADTEPLQRRLAEEGFVVSDMGGRGYFDSFFIDGDEGMLFEVATAPSFARDESEATTGDTLMVPKELAERREEIARSLEPIDG